MVNGEIALPRELEDNTIANIGFVLKNNNFEALVHVHGNETGKLSDEQFDEYTGKFSIDISNKHHELNIDDALKPHTKKIISIECCTQNHVLLHFLLSKVSVQQSMISMRNWSHFTTIGHLMINSMH